MSDITNETFLHSLQLQTGIIAACATSLKPLFRRILGLPLPNYRYGNNYNDNNRYGSRKNTTRRSVALRTISRSHAVPQDATDKEQKVGSGNCGDDDADSDKGELYLTTTGGNNITISTFYKHEDEETASAERILPESSKSPQAFHIKRGSSIGNPKGIVRTTEVTVERR